MDGPPRGFISPHFQRPHDLGTGPGSNDISAELGAKLSRGVSAQSLFSILRRVFAQELSPLGRTNKLERGYVVSPLVVLQI